MVKQHYQFLEYVRNTHGGATKDNFIEDWEPIGTKVWDELIALQYVQMREDGKIYLTLAGIQELGA